jgi:hypothetical protein
MSTTNSNYLKRFKEFKNYCFNLSLSNSNLANLAAKDLKYALRERLEGVDFYSLDTVLVRGMAQELRLSEEKEKLESCRYNVHMIDYVSVSLKGRNKVYVTKFVWLSKDKLCSCASIKPSHMGRQEELKITFGVSKCDRIFDDLVKLGHIKISHTMPPLDDMKRHAYCKYHNSYSRATNYCNVFCHQIQLAINECRLVLLEVQVDKQPFPINTMELQHPKVLVWSHQAEVTKGKMWWSWKRNPI